jgi:hypothetical protein
MRIEVPVDWTVQYKYRTASSAARVKPLRTVKLQTTRTSVYVSTTQT